MKYNVHFEVGQCPRPPFPGECLTGKVCVGTTGRVGIVSDHIEHVWGHAWVGFGVDGKGAWSSKSPIIIAETLEEYRQTMTERFPNQHIEMARLTEKVDRLYELKQVDRRKIQPLKGRGEVGN